MKYSKTEKQEFANGVNIIHFPDLTEEERMKRQQQLLSAMQQIGKELLRIGGKTNGN